jgi:hypothetical protein
MLVIEHLKYTIHLSRTPEMYNTPVRKHLKLTIQQTENTRKLIYSTPDRGLLIQYTSHTTPEIYNTPVIKHLKYTIHQSYNT